MIWLINGQPRTSCDGATVARIRACPNLQIAMLSFGSFGRLCASKCPIPCCVACFPDPSVVAGSFGNKDLVNIWGRLFSQMRMGISTSPSARLTMTVPQRGPVPLIPGHWFHIWPWDFVSLCSNDALSGIGVRRGHNRRVAE
jgi:hypothetical protein